MSFIQRELNILGEMLRNTPEGEEYNEIYAAQQALCWALDPDNFMSPVKLVKKHYESAARA